MSKAGYVYFLSSLNNRALYIGVTSDLSQRVWQHRNGYFGGFSKRYGAIKLVYYEHFESIVDAIAREKQLKNWHRDWKNSLVEKCNRDWVDLSDVVL